MRGPCSSISDSFLVSEQHTSRPLGQLGGNRRYAALGWLPRGVETRPSGHHCVVGSFNRSVRRLDRFQQRHRALAFPFAVRQKFAEDQGGYLAASVTYYAFFSIFPLLLVLVTLLGYALQSDPDLQRRVLDSALTDFPVIGPQLEDNVHSLKGSVAALAVGIGVAVWAGTGVALAVENALDHIWGVPIRRRVNPVVARLRALVWIALLGGITILGTVLGSASAIANYAPAVRAAALLISLAINIVVFLAVFRVLTSHRPSWRQVLPGALVAAFAWEVLQTVGGYIVDHQLRHASSTYGVFAIVIGLLSWMYIGATVTLLSAEVNVVHAHKLWPRSFSLISEQPLTSGDEDALRQRAGVEERRADEDVSVVFEAPERKV
jgi:membrane protein